MVVQQGESTEQPKTAKKEYWHEVEIGKKPQRWNYRSEYVGRLGLDKNHSRIWVSFGIISIIGFSAFVFVKSKVIQSRREQMQERERMRKMLDGNKPNFVSS